MQSKFQEDLINIMVCKVVIWFEQAILSLYYYFFTKLKKQQLGNENVKVLYPTQTDNKEKKTIYNIMKVYTFTMYSNNMYKFDWNHAYITGVSSV